VLFLEPSESPAVGVGSNDEDAEPAVGGAGVGSAYTTPPRIHPHFGQVCEYGSKCPHSVGWFVSHTPRAGFHVASGIG
jgi:hypothetical protein